MISKEILLGGFPGRLLNLWLMAIYVYTFLPF